MNKDFQPFFDETTKTEFSAWEYKAPVSEAQVIVDKDVEFAIECERLREEAQSKGYEAGIKQASHDIAELKKELEEWLTLIQKPVQLIDKSLSQEIVTTIMWICEACIGLSIENRPETLLTLLETIKKELPALGQNKQLLMNPDDVEWLKKQLDTQEKAILAILTPDSTMVRGDFYLKSEHNEMDGTLKTRLTHLIRSHFATFGNEENIGDNPLEGD